MAAPLAAQIQAQFQGLTEAEFQRPEETLLLSLLLNPLLDDGVHSRILRLALDSERARAGVVQVNRWRPQRRLFMRR